MASLSMPRPLTECIDPDRLFLLSVLMLECPVKILEVVMRVSIRRCATSLLIASLPLTAVAAPMHSQFLPPDDLVVRQEQPEQQQLLQVTEYSVVLGNQRQSNQQPIPVTSPLLVRLKGKPLNKGATISQVILNFDGESKSLKKPVFDEASKTLTLSYPQAQYRVVIDLLRNNTVYVQFLTYANGHIWADLHTGIERPR
ncbi:hypothetical protein SAMN03159488_00589 [Pseudomonas sp. NFIX10]|nr:hypothetical protein SAMN03159488_00589 [Pseudomonas sp. NFIX10]SFE18650.1 hypothetical protein SAMN03159367_00589 [Pseudomonas sp. NFACC06-1]